MKKIRLIILLTLIFVMSGCQTFYNFWDGDYYDDEREFYDDYDPWMEDEDYYYYE